MISIFTAKQIDDVIELMFRAFPPTEIRSEEDQRQLFRLPEYQLEILEENGQVIGFMAFWDLEGCIFVEHLAVEEGFQGQGLGSDLLDKLPATRRPIVMEVEPIMDQTTERRVEFYRRNGFRLCGFDYVQPPLRSENPEISLYIMSRPEQLTEDEFAPIKDEITRKVYNLYY